MVMPRETILLGADKTCPDCKVTLKMNIYWSPAGYYIGTFCNCGPYSRESSYYSTEGLAKGTLQNGDFGR